MSTTSPRRTIRLVLGRDLALSTTSLVLGEAREGLTLRMPGTVENVLTAGVENSGVVANLLHLDGLAAGARIRVTAQVSYGARVHGLARLLDPDDDSEYIVGSGALGGAARFFAAELGPDGRMPTTIEVSGAQGLVVATGSRETSSDGSTARFSSAIPLASHHVGLACGPWREFSDGPETLLARPSVGGVEDVAGLLVDLRRAREWVCAWFGEVPLVATARHTQVLLPDVPWLALEHPGCIMVSERLLDVRDDVARARRVAVLAHEVAHQWLGNLVSPRRWMDVGVFEGLAELIGQLACEAILGGAARSYLERRRSSAPLAELPCTVDEHIAGLAEVAGPVQHAELFRQAREELGATEFRARVRQVCRSRAGTTATAEDVWTALGLEVRRPPLVALPAVPKVGSASQRWDGLGRLDPATAAARARQAFRDTPTGVRRVRAALAAVGDPATPPAVVAGLAGELAAGFAPRNQSRDGHD